MKNLLCYSNTNSLIVNCRPRRANAQLVYGAVDRAGSMPGCIRRRLPRLNHVFVACSKLKHMVNTARMRGRPRRAVIGRRELQSCTISTTPTLKYTFQTCRMRVWHACQTFGASTFFLYNYSIQLYYYLHSV